MIVLILLPVIALTAFGLFAKSRRLHTGRHWLNQTFSERLAFSVGLSAAVQFLHFTMMPGWIVAAYLIGKGSFGETILGNAVWGIVMVTANTLFYLPLFYLLLKFSNYSYKKIQGKVFLK